MGHLVTMLGNREGDGESFSLYRMALDTGTRSFVADVDYVEFRERELVYGALLDESDASYSRMALPDW